MQNPKNDGANDSNKNPQEPGKDPGKTSGKWGRFLDLLVAVLTLDIPRMGGKVVLLALIRRLGNRDPQDKTGLRATLQTTTTLEKLQTRANNGDQLAYAELLYIATTATQTLAQVTADQPKLAAPFVRVNPTWPILALFYKSGEEDMPMDRLKQLKFGQVAHEVGLSKLTNKLGLLAWLLGIYSYLKSVVEGKDSRKKTSKRDNDAKSEWQKNARPILDETFPKLRDLPFEEAQAIKTHRQDSDENEKFRHNSTIRHQIKKWYLKFEKYTQELVSIAKPRNTDAQKDSQ